MNWLLLTGVLGLMAGPSVSEPDAEALIRALPPEVKTELLWKYEYSAWVFSKALKFRQPAAIFLSCPDKGCDPLVVKMLADLQEQAPATLGARVTDKDAAQIEVYLAPLSSAADARSYELDEKLHLNVNMTSRRLIVPDQDAPCWTVSYFHRTGVIEKAVIYIDSDSSSKIQYLCLGYETIRAAGVMSVDSVSTYRKDEKRSKVPVQWLFLNAYLHGLKAIEPGDSIAKVHGVLQDRYGSE